MTYSERMYLCCQELIKAEADRKKTPLSQQIAKDLRKIKRASGMMTSPVDDGLENLWDEICVQVQSDYSYCWDAYVDYMESCITKLLKEQCSDTELKMLWMQTEAFWDWSDCETQDEEDLDEYFYKGFPAEFQLNDVVHLILSEVLNIAENYSNSRIRKYLF